MSQTGGVSSGTAKKAGIKTIIAIASGKGGVGKSTTTMNLAHALKATGAKVGILDADIYGPNQPTMLGATEKPEILSDKLLAPVMCHGIQSMSIGYLLENKDSAMIWRGPMATSALLQLFNETAWDDLDYLLIDLPPGTGDIQLTLAQKIPLDGAIIVTTPQDIALEDARKGLQMFEKVKVPIFGIIENMATHSCSSCGHQEHIFGEGGGESMAERYKVPLLGSLPLDKTIRENADQGKPALSEQYALIAQKLIEQQFVSAKKNKSVFPKIVIENS